MAEKFVDVVTGASSGIGECVARELLYPDSELVVVARNEKKMRELFGEFPNVHIIALDLEKSGAAEELMKRIKLPIRYFVHAAGFTERAPIGMIDEEVMHRLFQVHAVFPLMFLGLMARKANHVESGAHAIVITSRSVMEPDRGNAAYCASKGAVEGMYETVASELMTRGIRFDTVAPGPVDTPMAHNSWLADLDEKEREAAITTLVKPESVALDILTLLKFG